MTARRALFTRRPWPRIVPGTFGNIMVVIAVVAMGISISRLSGGMLFTLFTLAGLFVGALVVARTSLKFVDIAAVVVVAFMTVGVMVPAIQHTRIRTGGRRAFPIITPVKLNSLILRGH